MADSRPSLVLFEGVGACRLVEGGGLNEMDSGYLRVRMFLIREPTLANSKSVLARIR